MLSQTTSEYTVDYNVHDVVGVRLVDPRPVDVAMVTKQLGPFRGDLVKEPDVTVYFVETLSADTMRNVEVNETGFTDKDFFIFDGKQRVTAKVAFDQVGQRCMIVSQTGMERIPLLIPILHLTALKSDYVALNASAFVHQDRGIVATGWSKGGKIEALLAFGLKGAPYVGDHWTLLSGDGEKMFGLPGNVGLWEWSLESPGKREPGQLRDLALIPSNKSKTARPLKFFLLITRKEPEFLIQPTDPFEIAERMMSVTEYEQWPVMQKYLAFKFAFPGRRNQLIEEARALQYQILRRALAGKEAYTVWHPYPVVLPRLYEAMSPFAEA